MGTIERTWSVVNDGTFGGLNEVAIRWFDHVAVYSVGGFVGNASGFIDD